MMASNQFLGSARAFNDSEIDEQPLSSSFYTLASCTFPQQHLQQGPYYMSEQASAFNSLDDSCMSLPPAPPLEADMEPFELGMSNYPYPSSAGCYYNYAPSQNTDAFHSNASGTQACPRSWQQGYDPRMMEDLSITDNYHYLPRESPHGLLLNNDPEFYTRRESMSRTPPSLPDAPSCKVEEDAEEDATSNNDETKTEEPYAKLIHRALMGAPNYSMALQEIYQWFIENTEKGSSPGSGWRNSIRHNLSMNAAFRKTDRLPASPTSDHPPKKTSEWVLEPWAITDGVTPTTRYRKNISKKSARPDHPSSLSASRQNAGKKGGNMAGKTKALRMQTRLTSSSGRDDCARGRDVERDREARRERKRYVQGLRRLTPPYDDLERERHLSPITPTAAVGVNGASPYYYKGSSFDDVMDVSGYDLSHVQGVYAGEEGGPIFAHDGLQRFGGDEGVAEYMWSGMQTF